MPRVSRSPSHAGSWYEESGTQLAQQIDGWLRTAAAEGPAQSAQAIIAPHAGYRYCGHVMAYAYRHIDPARTSRVFLLGPSHHVYSSRCLLSSAEKYDTPLGSMTIDQQVYSQLKETGEFDFMDLHTDEDEHSLELHTPYIKRVMEGRSFTLIPIMVGSLSPQKEAVYGKILGPYLDDPSNAFVISSDFCHWGSRFSFTFQDSSKGPIWKSIQWLDEQGMRIIEEGSPAAFTKYLAQYRNTICGRHPIGVLLNMLQHCNTKYTTRFRQYDQSSKCMTMADSSVSYAAATVERADDDDVHGKEA